MGGGRGGRRDGRARERGRAAATADQVPGVSGSPPQSQMDRRALLKLSWSTVATPYLQTFAPRFLPWTMDTLEALVEAQPPPGSTVVVAACGPGASLGVTETPCLACVTVLT